MVDSVVSGLEAAGNFEAGFVNADASTTGGALNPMHVLGMGELGTVAASYAGSYLATKKIKEKRNSRITANQVLVSGSIFFNQLFLEAKFTPEEIDNLKWPEIQEQWSKKQLPYLQRETLKYLLENPNASAEERILFITEQILGQRRSEGAPLPM